MDHGVKLKYQKYKSQVKCWEDEFMKNNGKIPSTEDIKKAPQYVRHAYKAYHALKKDITAATSRTPSSENSKLLINPESKLAHTLKSPQKEVLKVQVENATQCGIFQDDKVLSVVTKSLVDMFSEESEPKPKKSFIPVYNHSKDLLTKISSLQQQVKSQDPNIAETEETAKADSGEPTEEKEKGTQFPQNVKGVWGSHLNRANVEEEKNKSVKKLRERTSSFQFAEKIFNKSQFKSKRNPLKPHVPLRRSKSECFSLISGCSNSQSQPTSECAVASPLPSDIDSTCDSQSQDLDPFDSKDLEASLPSSMQIFASKFKVTVHDSSKQVQNFSNTTPKNLNEGWLSRLPDESSIPTPVPDNDIPAEMKKPVKKVVVISSEGSAIMPRNTEHQTTDNSFGHPKLSSLFVLDSGDGPPLKHVECPPLECNGAPKAVTVCQEVISESDDNEILSDSETETRPLKARLIQLKRYANEPGELEPAKKKIKLSKTPSAKSTKQEAFEKKVVEGKANDNFVRINLKKKIFVRGRKNTSYSKYKKMMYKKKQFTGDGGGGGSGKKGSCFTCGESGHWSNNCTKVDKLLPEEEAEQVDDSPYLTLEEAGALANQNLPPSRFAPMTASTNKDANDNGQTQEATTSTQNLSQNAVPSIVVSPLYSLLDCDGNTGDYLPDTPLEVLQVLAQFGYKTFRAGQEEAVMRVLCGMSTLVMLSTGAGKSLCYQLPAYLYAKRNPGCITLVVSPLVSLMDDQISNLPRPLRGACLHMNQSLKQREQVEEQLQQGSLHVLLVSPETVVHSERQGGLSGILKHLPPIAFACIDEAHCVSQWSHNFRPSYLMLCKVLREKLKVRTLLGLTATATSPTAASIATHLKVSDGRVISDMPVPGNLILSVSRDPQKDNALIKLLRGPRFSACDSIIIYCIRREECERIAGLLRTVLQDSSKTESKKARALSWNAEAYHAGLSPFRRKQVQQSFMSGNLRIVVATVAFGMGINKNNLRAVIHYNMPSSFERFVQEVGRAGRDGLLAHCHLFLDSKGNDLSELRRHIYGDSTDRHIVRKLLLRVFKNCRCLQVMEGWDAAIEQPENEEAIATQTQLENDDDKGMIESSRTVPPVECPGHEVAFLTESVVQALDLPEENILTLLCYLELHPKRWLEVLSSAYVTCKVASYGGPGVLKAAAKKCLPLAMAVAMDQKAGVSHEKSTSIEFPVINVASAMGWDSGQAKKQLKDLEWRNENGKWKRSNIVVQLSGPGMRMRAKGCLPPEDLDEALDWLSARVEQQEHSKLLQLEALFLALDSVAYKTCDGCLEEVDNSRVEMLKMAIQKYFNAEENLNQELKLLPGVENEDQVRADVCAMVGTFSDSNFTGRSVARIFHGVASPCFPPNIWGRTRYWRSHLSDNFNMLCRIASKEILRLRS